MLDHDTDLAARLARRDADPAPVPIVDVVESFDAFESLRPAWVALSARDPEATVFLSWDWLAAALRDNPRRWRIYIARNPENPGQIVGLLPLRLRVHWDRSREEFTTEMEAGGRLIYSEYTGFLCDPEWQEPALNAIARKVQGDPWSELSLRYEYSRGRAAVFAAAFAATQYEVKWKSYMINKGETDNLLCPRLTLPESYETYLQTGPSANTRQKIRRFTRRFLGTGEWHLTWADAGSFERDVDILLRHWMGKWAEAKGMEAAEKVAQNYRRVLTLAQELGCLNLPVLWHGDRPLGALGHILDHDMDRMHFIVAGRDTGADGSSIGLLLHAQSIRWGIENGFGSYDFCHGNEAYKYSFGARDSRVTYLSLRRRKLPKAFGLDRLNLPDALARVSGMIADGKHERAQQGLEQLAKLV